LAPTLRGWAVLLVSVAIVAVLLTRGLGRFLAVTDPVESGVMVVEGWAPDYAFEAAIAEFNRNHYEKLLVSGQPLERGAPLSEYKTYAEMGAAIVIKMGLSSNVVQAVPAPLVRQDRTYAMASAVKRWMHDHGMSATSVQLMTLGPHARRSRLVYERAFGKGVKIGIKAIPSRDFDPNHWWRTSAGVRSVLDEALAYVYARLLFHPPKEAEGGT
jgi:hypothetical protein